MNMTPDQIFSQAYNYQVACKFRYAIELYNRIIDEADEVNNQHPVHHNLGLCYRSTREFDKSIAHFQKAIELKPTKVSSWTGLGETYYCKGDYFQGHKFLEWNFADNTLSHPDFELSKSKRLDWEDPYVSSALTLKFTQKLEIPAVGDDELKETYKKILSKVQGKVINVRSTQGLGDVIQASYFIKELLKYNPSKIIVNVRFELLRLLYDLDEKIVVQDFVPYDEEFDYFIPATSLAKLLMDDGSAKKEWLKTSGRDVAFKRSIIKNHIKSGLNNRKLVGIVWRGNPKHSKDHLRSFTLEDFLPALGDMNDKIVFSLQFDARPDEIELMGVQGIINLGKYIHDLYAMSCFMQTLDYVITVDSAPAHLAGASGVSVVCLMPKGMEDFRWGYEGDTKLYETLRVIRFEKF